MRIRFLLLTALASLSAMESFAQVPKVTTDPRFVRGATMAFGRIKSATTNGGATISKLGFCYAETPEPTIDDNVSTGKLSNNGDIYWMKDLKPATKYYMRAYATNKNGETGYGEVIKFYTIPMGKVTYSLWRGEADDATYNRIKKAMEDACYYFNNMTSAVRDYDVAYSPGTPTADCNYTTRPHMNVGANQSYQRCGTIMHEMEHGLGLQNYSTQWCQGNLRSGNGTGYWLGDRVTQALQFWDNTTNSPLLNGDKIHMWPYGVNGAHEDSGTDLLYLGNSMICQALGEDGLEHSETCFAEPYYSLMQEDTIKFYIKNESADRGLNSAYLVPNANGQLKWRAMTTEEAAKNDSAAWFITFTPSNQYYQLRNAATDQYITYNSGIKTAKKDKLTSNENWHLMPGRVDVDGQRGYWIIHPEGNWSPHCLQANANGNTASSTFNIANSAESQRWLIMTLDAANEREAKAVTNLVKDAEEVLTKAKSLLDVAHTEDVENANQTFTDALADLSARLTSATNTSELTAIISEAGAASTAFLQSVTVSDPAKPFDLSYMLVNPTFDTNTDGWSVAGSVSYGCVEFYEKTFDFNQTIRQLPTGTYKVCVQGFLRPGTSADSYSDYTAGTNNVKAWLYAGSKTQKLAHICDTIMTKKVGKGKEATLATNKFVPNDMQSASAYFAKGCYENSVFSSVTTSGGTLKVGIRCNTMPTSYWAIFDNFRVYFYGNMTPEVITSIQTVNTTAVHPPHDDAIYTLDGRRLTTPPTAKGMYIQNGRIRVIR